MLTDVTIAVPDAVGGVSLWVGPSTISKITSAGLLSGAASSDGVVLCGSNDNGVAVTAAMGLRSFYGFVGSGNQSNAGNVGAALGAWLYYAIIRLSGVTHGLTFQVTGDG